MPIFRGEFIALTFWGIGKITQQNSHWVGNNDLDMANERHAKGEIIKLEYDQYKQDLS